MSLEVVACLVATSFIVLCVEQNMRISRSAAVRLARSVSSCTLPSFSVKTSRLQALSRFVRPPE
jgi:hypothetical protein